MTQSTSPFFIMGCKRSGTTLVSQILNSHSRLSVYHESYFYPIFHPQLRWYGDLRRTSNLNRLIRDACATVRRQGHEPPSAEAIRKRLVSPTFAGVFSTLLLLDAEAMGKVRGGDKTPEQHEFLAEILRQLPDSPVICLMRDPRDTVLSIQKQFGVSLLDAAHSWNTAVESYQLVRDHVHLVRYEDLVTRPQQVVAQIAEAVGEQYESGMLEFFQNVPEAFSSRAGGELLGSPLSASSVGGFRQMPEESIRLIEEACREGMELMGYEPAFPRQASRSAVVRPRAPSRARLLIDRLRYYGLHRVRWERGLIRWRLMLSLRLRYLLLLGPLRRDW